MRRALSGREVVRRRKPRFEFTGPWWEAFGKPGRHGIWIIWGNSGSGKTSFVMQLCKELSKFGKVAYNSLEEGDDVSMQDTLERFGIPDLGNRFQLLNCEPIDEMEERMNKPKSPDIYIVDSLQYSRMNYICYQRFKEAHKDKLVIFISHAKGKMPKGSAAEDIAYDASLKIRVEGYRALSKGRFMGPKKYYVIWEEGFRAYWGANGRDPAED